MSVFSWILLLGFALGTVAYLTYHFETYRRLAGQKRMVTAILRLAGVVLLYIGGSLLVKNLAAFGAPGQNVLETDAIILLPLVILVAGLADLVVAGSIAKGALKQAGKTIDTQRPITQALVWAIRIYIGVLFIYSGFVKANDYIGFSYKLEEYFQVFAEYLPFMAGFWKFWEGLAEPLAWFISVFEIALAVAILLGWKMKITSWLTVLMMVFFTILTGFSAITGEVTDCGCFGDALKLAPWQSFTKDLIYLVLLAPLFLVRKDIKPFPTNQVAMAVVLLVFLGSGIYGWYCHENLPVVDYRAYYVGKDLKKCTTEPGPDGIPKCKDWDEILYRDFIATAQAEQDTNFVMPAPIKPLEGDVMMVVAYKLEKASEEALKQSGDLARALEGVGVKSLLMTSTGPSTVEEITQATNLEYPVSFRDATMLKTIIRANPGYVLLRNGTVLGKWHHNNIPDLAEVQALLD